MKPLLKFIDLHSKDEKPNFNYVFNRSKVLENRLKYKGSYVNFVTSKKVKKKFFFYYKT